jgi:hypothetical protein
MFIYVIYSATPTSNYDIYIFTFPKWQKESLDWCYDYYIQALILPKFYPNFSQHFPEIVILVQFLNLEPILWLLNLQLQRQHRSRLECF